MNTLDASDAALDGSAADTGSDATTADAPDAASEAGLADARSDASTGDASMACNTLVNDGPTITSVCLMGAPPAGTGGSITNGLYHLTVWNPYRPDMVCLIAGTATASATIRYTSGVVEFNGTIPGLESGAATLMFALAGNQLTFSQLCPAVSGHLPAYDYDATPTSFTFRLPDSSGNVTTYTFTLAP